MSVALSFALLSLRSLRDARKVVPTVAVSVGVCCGPKNNRDLAHNCTSSEFAEQTENHLTNSIHRESI